MTTKLSRTLALAACLTAQAAFRVLPAVHAAVPAAPQSERIRQAELDQARIKAQTQRVAGELNAILKEFDSAGLGEGEDARVLRAIHQHLGELSSKDMDSVILLLQAARNPNGQAMQKVAEAFGGQKNIVVHLRHILLAYQQQQELYELSLLFGKLGERENGNLKLAKRLVRSSANKTTATLDENQRLNLSVQHSEQLALAGETKSLLAKLTKITEQVDAETAQRLRQSLASVEKDKLQELLSKAAEDLKAGAVYRAATTEMNARDQLRELSRLVAPPMETVDLLRHAAEEIQRAIIEQKALLPKTALLSEAKDEKSVEYGFELEEGEADVVDHVARIRKDIENAAPDAVVELSKGIDRMQEVRAAMVDRKKVPATAGETQAIIHLEAARSLVLARLAKEEQKEEQRDTIASLKELRDKVVALKNEEEALKTQTLEQKTTPEIKALAPTQEKLQTTARDLQAEASSQSVPAAEAIGEAAREMGEAKNALDKGVEAQQAAKPEQKAIDQLAKAEQILNDEIKKLEQAKQDLASLEEAREKVAELIKKETKVELATAKVEAAQQAAAKPDAAKPDAGKPDAAQPEAGKPDAAKPDAAKPDAGQPDAAKPDAGKPDAAQPEAGKPDAAKPEAGKPDAAKPDAAAADAKPLAEEQGKVEEETGKVAAELPAAGQTAAEPLQKAQGNMKEAKGDLAKNDAAGARPDEKQALANLNKAKDALDQKIAELEQQLGQPPDNAANADLGQAIAEAQAETAQAQAAQAAQQGQPPQGQPPAGQPQKPTPGQQLGKTAEKLAAAAAEASPPAAVAKPLGEAQHELADAAAQAEAGNQEASQKNAQAAQAHLAEAAAALALAQGGLPEVASAQGQGQHPPGQGQGQEPGQGQGQQPGQGQGQKPGQGQHPSQSNQESRSQGTGDRQNTHAAAGDNGDRNKVRGQGQFIGLPPRDRKAILQSQKESTPAEYAPYVEQYLKNLADPENRDQ